MQTKVGMKLTWYHGFFGIIILFLSGCGGHNRYVAWLNDVFYQGQKLPMEEGVAQQYVRSEHIYSQFSTLAHFSAIWLSWEMRMLYANVHARTHCLSSEEYQRIVQHQKEEHDRYIVFYLAASLPKRHYSTSLTQEDVDWSLCLSINGITYQPTVLQEVDLEPEYKMFFGDAYTHFRTSYIVKFPARDEHDAPLITPNTQSLCLLLNRADRRGTVHWLLDRHGNVIKTDRFNPNILAYPLASCF